MFILINIIINFIENKLYNITFSFFLYPVDIFIFINFICN